MARIPEEKAGVILLAMGGPETVDDVRAYLYNIFSDRAIIRLPGGRWLQKPFARLIAGRRAPKVQRHYEQIGGGSPLLKWTIAQRNHLEQEFREAGLDLPCYIGMRYARPFTEEAIEQAYGDGCGRMIFVPMYPQYCKATTGSSFEAARTALAEHRDVDAAFVTDFHDNPEYVALLREYIDTNIRSDETLLFSAHSIPQAFVDEGDPYVRQVEKTAALTAEGREHFLSFQSRSGPVQWVGPETTEETRRLLQEGRKVFIVPISFVCDHIETLHEIDIQLKELVGDGERIRRMPMFNDDPRLARMLAHLIGEKIHVG